MIQSISLEHVVPQVFASLGDLQSQVWQQSLTFERGHVYLIEADSGSGKSTFCSYILGYRHDYEGKILFDGQDVSSLKVSDWTRMRQEEFSYLFQELRLFPELTAYENVDIKNRLTHHQEKEKIEFWFERLGIAEKLNARVGQLSYGQQQRVAMMRALCQPFSFILVDEPISHLDDQNATVMAEMMMEEARAQEAGVIVTSIGKRMPLDYEKTYRL